MELISMLFDLQRFDSTEYGPKWIYQDENVDGYQGETLWFIPAGKTYTVKQEQRWWYSMQLTVNVPYPDGNETITINGSQYGKGLGSVPSPDTSTTITTTLKAGTEISDITVTGSDRHLLRITIDGVEYTVGDDGHLKSPSVSSGSIKVYHEGAAQVVTNIYDTKKAAFNLAIRHNNSDYYIPLTATKPSAPCLAVRNEGAIYYAMK